MRNYIVGFALIGTLLLSGCTFGSSTEEELSSALSEMNSAEKDYRGAQKELNSLEESEQATFNEMMALTQEQQDELESKVTEVEESLEKRLAQIKDEEASMKKAMETVSSFDKIIDKAEEDSKSEIEKLKEAISDRYNNHSTFIEEYKKLSDMQKELYAKITSEAMDIAALQGLVGDVNEQNDVVKDAIESFNDATLKVNEMKEKVFNHLKKE